MSKENQITKEQVDNMAKDLCSLNRDCETCPFTKRGIKCNPKRNAERALSKGYRKQSENTVVLPCKVGDTVYYPAININTVLLYKVISIKLNSKGLYIVCESRLRNEQMTHKATQIGKTIFLTEGEANTFLAKMKGGE